MNGSPGGSLGKLIDGRFRLVRLAARGGTADVFEAEDRVAGERVAVKVLREVEGDWRERFGLEAEALSQLSHPAIVRFVAHGVVAEGLPYLATEWLEGETLRERLRRGKLPEEESLALLAWVCDGLAVAHDRGLIHRDIKPGNIVLTSDPAAPARLIDFGLIRRRSAPARTLGGLLLGTAGYMSPEQIRAASKVDARSDVFSVGCVLFECLTGVAPYRSDDLIGMIGKVLFGDTPRVSDHDPTVAEGVVSIVARMMHASPESRPANARQVASLLRGGSPEAFGEIAQDVASMGITDRERRILCAVLAGDGRDGVSRLEAVPEQDDATMVSALLPVGILEEIVEPYGGVVELLGRGLVLVSLRGSPGNMDHASHAARCALELRAQMPVVPIVLVSGRSDPGAPLAVGEMFDRGARMIRVLAGAPSTLVQTGIRVDEVTEGLLGSRFEVVGDSLGLLLRREVRQHAGRRALLGKATPCVGREREMAFLEGVWAECLAEPRSRFAVISGPAGLGKSRLRSEMAARLRTAHPTAQQWIAESDPRRAGSPLATFRALLGGAAGLPAAETDTARLRRLSSRVARRVSKTDSPRVTAFLAEAAGLRSSDDESVELRAARSNPSLMGDQIERAWLDFVAAECRHQPTILILDDAQWADEASLRLVAAAIRSLRTLPLLVMAFGRPEVFLAAESLDLGEALVLEQLHTLSPAACERLVRAVLPSLDSASARRIGEIAGGNPFFLEELVRVVAVGRNPSDAHTVVALMQSRLEELPASARRVLRAASTFGESFRIDGLRHLLGDTVSQESLARDLRTLCDRELIGRLDDEGEGLVFRHALVRDASYSMLTDDDRKLAHRLAGEWLEREGEQDGWLMANHHVAADDGERAAAWFARAAEQASEINDNRRALECAELGVRYTSADSLRARLLVLQAEAARWLGSHARAAEAAREAASLLEPGAELWPRALEESIRALARLGDGGEASALARKLIEYGGSVPATAPLSVLYCRVALAVVALGESEAARDLIRLAESASSRASRRDPLLDAYLAHARAVATLHGTIHFDQYASALEQTITAFGVLGDLRGVSAQSVNLGYILTSMGALERAAEALEMAIQGAEPRSLHHIVAAARHNLGYTLALGSAPEEGLELERHAVAAFEQQGDRRLEGAARAYCARILTMMGRLGEAESEARRGLSLVQPFPGTRTGVTATLAHVLAQREQFDEVLALLETSASGTAKSTIEDDGTGSVALATALLAKGRRQEGRGVVASACTTVAARAATIADRSTRLGYLLFAPRAAEIARLAGRLAILYPGIDDLGNGMT